MRFPGSSYGWQAFPLVYLLRSIATENLTVGTTHRVLWRARVYVSQSKLPMFGTLPDANITTVRLTLQRTEEECSHSFYNVESIPVNSWQFWKIEKIKNEGHENTHLFCSIKSLQLFWQDRSWQPTKSQVTPKRACWCPMMILWLPEDGRG